MAELGAAIAIASALSSLGLFLHNKTSFLLDIEDNIKWLEKELSWMQSFLKDAERKLHSSSRIEKWESDVRELAYECADVIDTFLKSGTQVPQPGCIGTMSRCFLACNAKFSSTVNLCCQIDKLMKQVTDLSSRRERYGLVAGDVFTKSDSTETRANNELMVGLSETVSLPSPYANNEHMVGLGETISLLEGKLTNGGSGRFVISILGMGGLGKTTLARKLYKSLSQEYFESYAWVCVSQEYNTRVILRYLIKSMVKPEPTKEDLERMTTEHSMEAYLRNWLSGRRFLVVMDDVWEREAWESLERAFPDNNKSSRVIITTRNKHVAALNTAYVHELRYLQDYESWELFCKKAFPCNDIEMICPPNLELLGREMVTKCSGLPLAIITLGGLLSTKSQVLGEWEMVRDNLWTELKKDSVHINAVLLLSYKDLPQNLKPCFLYVGMFPEDFEISISKLILMWVAEGFIGQEEGSPEDTAKSYFNELVGRNLIQKKSEDWIGSTCRVHVLLRDMAISLAKEMCFSLYYDGKTTSNLSNAVSQRRLTYMACDNIPSSYINPSLRAFCQRTTITGSHPNPRWNTALFQSLKGFSLLRVLDIHIQFYGEAQVIKIPGEIGKLIDLRYLGLGQYYRKVKFPKTISNLKALETLSLCGGRVTLPKTMVKLKNLRHLIGRGHSSGVWIGKLTGLETLEDVSYDHWCAIVTTRLVKLRHLVINNVPNDEANPVKFYDKLERLKMLQTLHLIAGDFPALGWISPSEIFKRCPSITHFSSRGMSYNQSADLHEFAQNLEVLEMVLDDLPHDPIHSIKKLPKLRALRIEMNAHSRGTEQLICSDGGFTQLRTLKIEINGDCEFVVEEGSLPSLTRLEINRPDRLIAPDTMDHLIMKTY